MSDGHYDAPAYCAICDRPIATGPICDTCNEVPDNDDELLANEWGGMDWHERTEFVTLNLTNGNLTDAITFVMHDGDVRPDSVQLIVRVMRDLILEDPDLTDDADNTVRAVADQLIRLIDRWETT